MTGGDLISKPSRMTLAIIGAVVTITVSVAVMGVQFQSVLEGTTSNGKSITELSKSTTEDLARIEREAEDDSIRLGTQHDNDTLLITESHDADIARLDESNRNRRDAIADLNARISVLEEQMRLLLQSAATP